jgi:hypothetical protein
VDFGITLFFVEYVPLEFGGWFGILGRPGSSLIKRRRTSGSSSNDYIDTHTDHAAFVDTLGDRFILVRGRSWG